MDKFNSQPLVKSAKAWAWWSFKKGGDITWIISTTVSVVIFPLVLSMQYDVAFAEQERAQVQQWQQQGYTQAQINQMLGMPPQQTQ